MNSLLNGIDNGHNTELNTLAHVHIHQKHNCFQYI